MVEPSGSRTSPAKAASSCSSCRSRWKARCNVTTRMPAKTLKPKARRAPKAPAVRLSLSDAMSILEKSGSAQTRKTYARHGAEEPMFGVSFATLKSMQKRIGVDHDLARGLWETGNFDARNLAVKVVDPARMSPSDLDRWAGGRRLRMWDGDVAALACETPHARGRAEKWLAAKGENLRSVGWGVVGAMALRDETTTDAWFSERLAEIEESIRTAPNG